MIDLFPGWISISTPSWSQNASCLSRLSSLPPASVDRLRRSSRDHQSLAGKRLKLRTRRVLLWPFLLLPNLLNNLLPVVKTSTTSTMWSRTSLCQNGMASLLPAVIDMLRYMSYSHRSSADKSPKFARHKLLFWRLLPVPNLPNSLLPVVQYGKRHNPLGE